MSIPPEQPGERLRSALDGFAPKARPGFREELAARLAAGVDPTLEEALDGLQPEAREEFRAQLRGRFVRPARPSRRRTPASPRRTNLRLVAGGLVAAAAALVLWILWPADAAPRFVVDDASFVAAGLSIDGEAVTASITPAEFARRLAGAGSVATGEHRLRFLFEDQFVVELDPATRLDLSGLASAEGPRVLANDGSAGGYRVATTVRFDRARGLEFRTPARSMRVVGTVFGVDVYDPETVCICCRRGEVRTFCPKGLTPEESVVSDGTLFASGTDLSRKHRFEDHQGPLRDLHAFRDTWAPAQ